MLSIRGRDNKYQQMDVKIDKSSTNYKNTGGLGTKRARYNWEVEGSSYYLFIYLYISLKIYIFFLKFLYFLLAALEAAPIPFYNKNPRQGIRLVKVRLAQRALREDQSPRPAEVSHLDQLVGLKRLEGKCSYPFAKPTWDANTAWFWTQNFTKRAKTHKQMNDFDSKSPQNLHTQNET